YSSYKLMVQSIALGVDIVLIAVATVLSILMIKDHNLGATALMNLLVAGTLALIASVAPFTHPHFNARNPLFGFRSNFTLSSDGAWKKVNSFSSIAIALSALFGYVLTLIFIDWDFAVVFISSILLGIIPCIVYHEVLRNKKGD
ncbi:MAG: SdpI family protein, partial [Bacilli bacterium]|nr:SdpI family protein [Bacilli bacterium]